MQKLLLTILLSWISYGMVLPQEDTIPTLKKQVQYDSITSLNNVSFDKGVISNYKDREEFNYLQKEEKFSWWTGFKRWVNQKYQRFLDWLFGDYRAGWLISALTAIVPYLLLGGLLALIIWLFIKLNPGRSILEEPRTSQVFLNKEEEIVQSQDIKKLIAEAIENGNFRLVIRYYYLLVLQDLDQKKVITYQLQKTNEDYLSEISTASLQEQFKVITRMYDHIWYGSFEISPTNFKIAEQDFLKMISILNIRLDE